MILYLITLQLLSFFVMMTLMYIATMVSRWSLYELQHFINNICDDKGLPCECEFDALPQPILVIAQDG